MTTVPISRQLSVLIKDVPDCASPETVGDAGNRTPASPQPHPVYNQDELVTGRTSTTTTVQRMRDSIMDNCRLHMICIFLFSSGAGRDSIVTGQYAASPLVHVVVGAARMHCSLTGQPERVPARNPQHARSRINHIITLLHRRSCPCQCFRTKAVRKLYCQLTSSPAFTRSCPLPIRRGWSCWPTCLAGFPSSSTHTEQPPAPIFTLVRTQPHPNHPIRYASPQSNTLVFSNVVRCKCQRVDLACWGPAPEES